MTSVGRPAWLSAAPRGWAPDRTERPFLFVAKAGANAELPDRAIVSSAERRPPSLGRSWRRSSWTRAAVSEPLAGRRRDGHGHDTHLGFVAR
jgi:hypothetical protein